VNSLAPPANGALAHGATWAADGSDAAVAAALDAILAQPGPITLALPGGSTPAPILALARDADWTRAVVWPTDERVLPPDAPADHPARNGAAIARALAGPARIATLEAGAVPPGFHLAWVGMGADGHVASIFPGMALSDDGMPGVAAVTPDPLPPEAPFPRLTLTMASLSLAPHVWIVARGEAKRRVLEAGDAALPVHRLLARAGERATIFWSEA
jgi:6-phosphogluconolactonase